jgi:hypothetical protein
VRRTTIFIHAARPGRLDETAPNSGMVPWTIAMLRRVRASQKRMPQFLAGAPNRCERLRAEIGQTTDIAVLASLWPAKVRPLLEEAMDMLAAAGTHGTTLLSVPGKLAKLVGEADSALLPSGQQAEGLPLASLGPVTGFGRLARGERRARRCCLTPSSSCTTRSATLGSAPTATARSPNWRTSGSSSRRCTIPAQRSHDPRGSRRRR